MPSGLVINQIHGATVVNFRNSSILDGASVEAISRELYILIDQQAQKKVVLDFAEVKFLSSTMVGVLIALHRKAASIKGKVVLCGLRPELFKIFKIMRLDKELNFAADEPKALEAMDIFIKS